MVKLTAILNWNGFHNIPKKYIQRRMFKGVVYENTHQMTPTVVYNYTKDWLFDEHAPWTTAASDNNDPSRQRGKYKERQIILPLKEWFFYRGDRVEVMKGKDAGKQGLVNAIIKQRNWVYVDGLNCKLTGYNMGRNVSDVAYQQKEQPLVVNRDVKLVDPSDLKPCEVEHRYTESGEKVRVSKRTGQVIPIPPDAEATIDYAKKSAYKPGEKDTVPDILAQVTFEPKYKTFEQDLMDEYNIKETRQRAPTFIY